MSQKYHIQSEDTKYYIISHNEKEGEIIITLDGKVSVPEYSVRVQSSHFLGVFPGTLTLL